MVNKVDDNVIVATYTSLRQESGATADSILVDPVLRTKFLETVRGKIGPLEEEPVLRRLLNLRKQCRLPRG